MQINQALFQSPAYPGMLAHIDDPPKQLFSLGKLPKQPSIAIVGPRNPTPYGRQITYQLAYELAAAGFTIVSGLAAGIDSIAHQAALDAGGLTVAVQGCGLDRVYPWSNRDLATHILQAGGAIVSEYAIGTAPFAGNFVRRNRIIAGLSLGVIVTEASATSGALHTANYAIKYNRQLFAVPGPVTSLQSAGSNNLLRQGAIAITGSHDVIAELGGQLNPAVRSVTSQHDPRQSKVIQLIKSGADTTQKLIEQGEFNAAELADVMSLMEITGHLRNLGAGQWAVRT